MRPFDSVANARGLLLAAAMVLALSGCIGQEAEIQVRTDAFGNGKQIPTKYTCYGENVSPPLSWSGVPGGTQALALIVTDTDAKDFVHWVVIDMPPSTTRLDEGASGGSVGVEAKNEHGTQGWWGPCPGLTGPHQYVFTLYALSAPLDLPASTDAQDVQAAIEDNVLARGELAGIYTRSS